MAVLVGDAMLSLAHEVLLESMDSQSHRACAVLAAATRELIAGQAQDMSFERRSDVSVGECVDMVAGKTAALLWACTTIGAVLAGAPADVAGALGRYGRAIGVAFQFADDLLGIWGDPRHTGKPECNDLRAGKKSLPVTWTLRHGGTAGAELSRWLAGARDEASLGYAAALIESAGGRDWATAQADRYLADAAAALGHPSIDEADRLRLEEFGRTLVERSS
jgi:geranylgeranyl diphosphate synthase type I